MNNCIFNKKFKEAVGIIRIFDLYDLIDMKEVIKNLIVKDKIKEIEVLLENHDNNIEVIKVNIYNNIQ